MFRSHFVQNGGIVAGEDLSAIDLDEAIAEAKNLLTERGKAQGWEGVEIWSGPTMMCAFSDLLGVEGRWCMDMP